MLIGELFEDDAAAELHRRTTRRTIIQGVKINPSDQRLSVINDFICLAIVRSLVTGSTVVRVEFEGVNR